MLLQHCHQHECRRDYVCARYIYRFLLFPSLYDVVLVVRRSTTRRTHHTYSNRIAGVVHWTRSSRHFLEPRSYRACSMHYYALALTMAIAASSQLACRQIDSCIDTISSTTGDWIYVRTKCQRSHGLTEADTTLLYFLYQAGTGCVIPRTRLTWRQNTVSTKYYLYKILVGEVLMKLWPLTTSLQRCFYKKN